MFETCVNSFALLESTSNVGISVQFVALFYELSKLRYYLETKKAYSIKKFEYHSKESKGTFLLYATKS